MINADVLQLNRRKLVDSLPNGCYSDRLLDCFFIELLFFL